MSTNTDTRLDPKEEIIASTEPKLAQHETELVTHPKGDESLESANKPAATYTEAAANVASSAAETVTGTVGAVASSATGAAANMKDSVFSMFGGGQKKEKKEEEVEPVGEKSGSSKARKEAEDEEEVCGFDWTAALCCRPDSPLLLLFVAPTSLIRRLMHRRVTGC